MSRCNLRWCGTTPSQWLGSMLRLSGPAAGQLSAPQCGREPEILLAKHWLLSAALRSLEPVKYVLEGFRGHASQAKGGFSCSDHMTTESVQIQVSTAHMHLALALLGVWGNQAQRVHASDWLKVRLTWRSRFLSNSRQTGQFWAQMPLKMWLRHQSIGLHAIRAQHESQPFLYIPNSVSRPAVIKLGRRTLTGSVSPTLRSTTTS